MRAPLFAIVVAPALMKPARNGSTRLELLIWPVLAFLCFIQMEKWRPLPLVNDSYQYLNVAGNISAGRGMVTTLVHFDSERSSGRMPAPLTTFPPGYPVAIALVSRWTGSLESAGRILSGVGLAGTAALLIWGLRALGSSFLMRQLVLLLFAANASTLTFATAVLTESTFMLVSTGAVLGLIALERDGRGPYAEAALAVLAYTLTGISYCIRYAGLFLIIAVLGYTVLQFLLERNRRRTVCLIAAVIPLLLAGAIMWRNISTVGTWRGGNEMAVRNPLSRVTANYVRAQFHLILGQHPFHFGLWEMLTLVGFLGIGAVLVAALRNAKWHKPRNSILLVSLCVAIYSAGIFYAGLSTPISFGTRMFVPILPLYLLLLGVGLTWLASRSKLILLTSAVLLCVAGDLGSNARDLSQPLFAPEHEILALEYTKPIAGGEPLRDWIQSHISPDDPIFSEDGQATGFLLHRPTVSLVGPIYSQTRWECEKLRTEMARFGASYLILYKASPNIDDVQLLESSKFLAPAVSQSPACGFVVAAENPDVRVLQLTGVRN